MHFFLKNSQVFANSSLFLLSFTIGSFPIITSIALVLFCVFNVLHGYLNRKEIKSQKFMIMAPIWGILIIYLLSLVYSPNLSYGIKYISRSQVFLLIPFVFWFRGGINEETYLKTTKFFIFGITISCILSLIIATFKFLASDSLEEFTYYELAETIGLHPTYFSLFLLTALVFLNRQKELRNLYKFIIVILCIAVLILLQSRIALLGLIVVIFYSLFASSKKYRKLLLLSSVLILILGITSKDLKERYKEIILFKFTSEVIGTFEENGINQRIWLWSNAFQFIKEQPVFGYGLGAQRNLFKWQVEKGLLEQEFDNELQIAEKNLSDKNFHNQYLQIWYECGLLGLLAFIMALFGVFYTLFKRKEYAQLIVLILFVLFLLTENIIARQMGIFYFAFIFSVFLSTSKELDLK